MYIVIRYFYQMRRDIDDDDYRRLLEVRDGLRRFLRWSEEQAAVEGLTPAQHQLLLAIRGHDDDRGPTVGEVAEHLLLRHHSAVGLIDRAVASSLVRRLLDRDDRRVVRLALTPRGSTVLERLAPRHLDELAGLAHRIGPLLRAAGVPAAT
jgi:DNA-binding MarR family transcriptional regulator